MNPVAEGRGWVFIRVGRNPAEWASSVAAPRRKNSALEDVQTCLEALIDSGYRQVGRWVLLPVGDFHPAPPAL